MRPPPPLSTQSVLNNTPKKSPFDDLDDTIRQAFSKSINTTNGLSSTNGFGISNNVLTFGGNGTSSLSSNHEQQHILMHPRIVGGPNHRTDNQQLYTSPSKMTQGVLHFQKKNICCVCVFFFIVFVRFICFYFVCLCFCLHLNQQNILYLIFYFYFPENNLLQPIRPPMNEMLDLFFFYIYE